MQKAILNSILYKGTHIIGYAHIQLWPENKAVLRMIVIDEAYRKKGLGGEFLKLCECWLSHQNISTPLIQSSSAAFKFYCNNEYLGMPFDDLDTD